MTDLAELTLKIESIEAELAAKRLKELEDRAAGVERGTDKVTAANKRGEASFRAQTEEVVRAVTAYITLSKMYNALAANVSEVVEFERQLAQVGKTTGLVGDDLNQLGQDLAALSGQLGASSEALLHTAQIAGQMGIEGSANILKFTKTLTELAAVSDLTAETGARQLSRLLFVTRENVDSIDKLASTIVALGLSSNATEKEITKFAGDIARAGAQFGITSRDAVGLGTAFAEIGVQSEVARSAMVQTFRALADGSKEGALNLKLLEAVLGKSGEEIRGMLATDPTKLFVALVAALAEIDEAARASGKSSSAFGDILRQLGVDNLRSVVALQALAATHERLNSRVEQARKAYEENTAASEAFSRANATLSKSWEQLTNTIAAVRLRFVQLLPHITEVVKALTDFVAVFFNVDGATDRADKGVQSLIAALRVLAGIMAAIAAIGFAGILLRILPAVLSVTNATVLFNAALAANRAALTFALGPAGLLLGLLAALAVAMYNADSSSERLRMGITALIGTLSALVIAFAAVNVAQFAAQYTAAAGAVGVLARAITGLYTLLNANPYIAITTLVLGLVYALYQWAKADDATTESIRRMRDTMQEYSSITQQAVDASQKFKQAQDLGDAERKLQALTQAREAALEAMRKGVGGEETLGVVMGEQYGDAQAFREARQKSFLASLATMSKDMRSELESLKFVAQQENSMLDAEGRRMAGSVATMKLTGEWAESLIRTGVRDLDRQIAALKSEQDRTAAANTALTNGSGVNLATNALIAQSDAALAVLDRDIAKTRDGARQAFAEFASTKSMELQIDTDVRKARLEGENHMLQEIRRLEEEKKTVYDQASKDRKVREAADAAEAEARMRSLAAVARQSAVFDKKLSIDLSDAQRAADFMRSDLSPAAAAFEADLAKMSDGWKRTWDEAGIPPGLKEEFASYLDEWLSGVKDMQRSIRELAAETEAAASTKTTKTNLGIDAQSLKDLISMVRDGYTPAMAEAGLANRQFADSLLKADIAKYGELLANNSRALIEARSAAVDARAAMEALNAEFEQAKRYAEIKQGMQRATGAAQDENTLRRGGAYDTEVNKTLSDNKELLALQRELEQIDAARAARDPSFDKDSEAAVRYRQELLKLKQAQLEVEEENRRLAQTTEDFRRVGEQWGSSMGNAFLDWTNGVKSAREAVNGLVVDLIRAVQQMVVVEGMKRALASAGAAAGSWIGTVFGAAGAAGGGSGTTVASAYGNVFSHGDVTAFADGGVVSGPVHFPLANGRRGLMGEAGPEAIMPLTRGADGKLGVQASGGGGQRPVVVNVSTPNADSFRQSSGQISRVIRSATSNRR